MEKLLARYWWSFIIRGIAALVFGIGALMMPGITLRVLVLLVGAYFLVDGVFSIVASFGSLSSGEKWWLFLFEGLAGIIIGVSTFAWPGITTVIILVMIACWAFITGALEIAAAIRLRKEITGEWFLALSGILSLAFAFLILIKPMAGALAVVWLIGLYAVLFGLLLVFLGLALKKFIPPPPD